MGDCKVRRTKCALLVDFDNIYSVLQADFLSGLPAWMKWLEDGAFSKDGRPRKFVAKKVYWNTQFDLFREQFESQGFQAFNCRAVAAAKTKKSSADMFIAMDAIEQARQRDAPGEIIILSADSDFLPLVNRLQTHKCRVVMAGRESDFSLGLYREHADAVVHMTALRKACSYIRPKRQLFGLLAVKAPVAEIDANTPPPAPERIVLPGERIGKVPVTEKPAPPVATSKPVKAKTGKRQPKVHIDINASADIIAKLGAETPDQPISRAKIIKALSDNPTFNMNPMSRIPTWLGKGSYTSMIEAMAAVNANLVVRRYQNGGAALAYRIPTEDAHAPAAPATDSRPELQPV